MRRSKKESTRVLTDLESVLKAKIEEVGKIEDLVDQLLAYKALRDATVGTYDESKADKSSRESAISDAEEVGKLFGILGGLGGCIAVGTVLASTVLTGGLAALAIIPSAAILVGSGLASIKISEKIGVSSFNKRRGKLPLDVQQATNMFEMQSGLDKAIEGLTNSVSHEVLEQSPRLEEVKRALPKIADKFNREAAERGRLAGITEKQKAFLGQAAAQTPSAPGR